MKFIKYHGLGAMTLSSSEDFEGELVVRGEELAQKLCHRNSVSSGRTGASSLR